MLDIRWPLPWDVSVPCFSSTIWGAYASGTFTKERQTTWQDVEAKPQEHRRDRQRLLAACCPDTTTECHGAWSTAVVMNTYTVNRQQRTRN